MKKVSVYGPTLEVDGIMYNFSEFIHTKDCQFLLDVVDKFDYIWNETDKLIDSL